MQTTPNGISNLIEEHHQDLQHQWGAMLILDIWDYPQKLHKWLDKGHDRWQYGQAQLIHITYSVNRPLLPDSERPPDYVYQ